MNKLACQVTECANNQNSMCCLSKIMVDGPRAKTCDGTCCASFTTSTGATNHAGSNCDSSPDTKISCKANHCTHNQGGKCDANNVTVGSLCSCPSVMCETECCTFKCC